MLAELFRGDWAIHPVTHVPWLYRVVLTRLGYAYDIEVTSLSVVEHRVLEIRVWIKPRLFLKVRFDVGVLENTTMAAEHNSAQHL